MVRKALWTATTAPGKIVPAELPERYLAFVLGYVTARLGIGPESEDITIAVFGEACAKPTRLPRTPATPGNDPMRAYLVGMARRKVALVLRLRARRKEEPLGTHEHIADGTPESVALTAEAKAQLHQALQRLPELQREVLLLKYREELSLVEIGLALGKKPNAVGQLLHRAREAIRKDVGDYFND